MPDKPNVNIVSDEKKKVGKDHFAPNFCCKAVKIRQLKATQFLLPGPSLAVCLLDCFD